MSSSHNERIKYIYGNYNFWSWIRYWYLDTANQVTLILMDKGYYDYDYKPIEIQTSNVIDLDTMEIPSYDQTQHILSNFGVGIYAKKKNLKDMSMEQLQEHAIQDMQKDKVL